MLSFEDTCASPLRPQVRYSRSAWSVLGERAVRESDICLGLFLIVLPAAFCSPVTLNFLRRLQSHLNSSSDS